MCRNIKPLFNYDPPASHEEISEASLQFVRKITGFRKPSKKNEKEFQRAVVAISNVCRKLLDNLETQAAPKNRLLEMEKARERAAQRFS